ncbi:MAG: DUF6691 family protein [Bacteroidota bacterium]
MKKYIGFLFVGIVFGITMTKSEAISWYRIQEMFRFQSFYMYGIIMTAVVLGAGLIAAIKRFNLQSWFGQPIHIPAKAPTYMRYIIGGTIFGLGWAATGACPGPMYVLVGNGLSVFLVVILSAVFGTFIYGMVRHRLPH